MDVLIFKTDIQSNETVTKVAPYLNSLDGVKRWNFDLEDIDNILRVESAGISPGEIEKTLAVAGCYCEELPD